MKKYSLNKNDKVRKIKIILEFDFKQFYCLFGSCDIIKKVLIIKYNRKNIINMRAMFANL